jgi:transposase-like protein
MLLPLPEAHERLLARGIRVTYRTVHRMVNRKELDGRMVGGRWYVTEESLEQILGG